MRVLATFALLAMMALSAYANNPFKGTDFAAPAREVNHLEAMQTSYRAMAATFKKVNEFATKASTFQTEDAATCLAAVRDTWHEFLRTTDDPSVTRDGSCSALRDLFETNWDTATESDVAASIESHCGGDCATKLLAHFVNVRRECKDLVEWDQSTRDAWRDVARVHRVICMRDARDGLCFPKFIGMVRTMEALGADPPADQIPFDRICTRCNRRIFKRIMSYDDVKAGARLVLRLVCMRSWNKKFCAREMYEVGKMFDRLDAPGSTLDDAKKAFKRLCETRCFHRIIRLLLNSPNWVPDKPEDRDNMKKLRRFLICARHRSGEFCLLRILRVMNVDSSSTNTDPCDGQMDTTPRTCSDTCKTAIRDADLGCCAAMLFNIVKEDDATEGQNLQDWYTQDCGFPVGEICRRRVATAVIAYRGFKRTWIENNMAVFKAAIQIDVARAAGVDKASVVVTVVAYDVGADGTLEYVRVTVEIRTTTGGVTQVFRGMWEQRSFPTNDVSALNTASNTDPATGVSVDPDQSTVTGDEREDGEEEGLSSGAKAGIALAVLAVVAVVGAIVAVVIIKKKKSGSSAAAQISDDEVAMQAA